MHVNIQQKLSENYLVQCMFQISPYEFRQELFYYKKVGE